MKKILLLSSLLSISSAAFGFNGLCIYSDNKTNWTKPNGSILETPVNLTDGQSREIVSLSESSGLLQASLSVSGGLKTLSVLDATGNVLYSKSSDLNSGNNFLASFSPKIQASIVCVPSHQ